MMGRSHLMLGAAGFLACEGIDPTLLGSKPLGTAQLAAGTLIACGAAMIPDIDHPQATLARSLPPVSMVVSKFVNKIAGGHRKGTHTLWCWILVALATKFALALSSGPIIALGISVFCALLMLRVLTESDGLICLLLACILGGAAVLAGGADTSWLTQAVIIGFGLHLVGDIVTTEGIPFFYPFGPNFKIPILGSTDHFRERWAGRICGLIAFALLVSTVFLPGWHAQQSQATAQAATAPVAQAAARPATTPAEQSNPGTVVTVEHAPKAVVRKVESAAHKRHVLQSAKELLRKHGFQ
jgi:membrane-bound metal-dependent hydrolase YbcI (DUF457 family)